MVDIPQNVPPVRAILSPIASESAGQNVPAAIPRQTLDVQVASEQGNKSSEVQVEKSSKPAVSAASSSNIVTFRDGETGRLVVKLVGSQNNEVLAEFPSPNQLSRYPKLETVQNVSRSLDAKV